MFIHCESKTFWYCVLIASAVSSNAAAADYDEAIDGDLSGDRLNPTQLVLTVGTNSLSASTGAYLEEEEIVYDLEYLRIDLPANHRLAGIQLAAFAGDDGAAFIGVQAGTTFSFDPDEAFSNIGNLLGYAHFGPNEGHNPGDDILPAIAAGPGAIGFIPPLSGPSYTFWIQQTGAATDYRLNFLVTAVPEPATATFTIAALFSAAACGLRARRRHREH